MSTPKNALRKQGVKTKPSLSALQNFDSLPDSAYVRLPVVEALYGCSAATVWRRVKDGGIPAPARLSVRISGWNVGLLRQSLSRFG
jgi:predicted DNA-binding transcriptional regulator AlpA